MAIEITSEAVGLLRRSLEMGGLDPALVSVRLRMTKSLGGGLDLQVEFVDTPGPDDVVIDEAGVRILLDPGLTELGPDMIVTVEPQHERIVLRPRTEP